MAISSINRLLSNSFRFQIPKFSLPISTVSSAEKFWTHLQKNGLNPERTLTTIGANLDVSCIRQVLVKCASNQSLLGLRFFIWAGLQPGYRHSSHMYAKACELCLIRRNPQLISDLIECYRIEGCFVTVKTLKLVLNLCREARLADEGLWVLRKMKEFNCRPDTTIYNVVIRLFCDKGDVDVAFGLMREMGLIDLYPDMITYVSLIKGFCSAGKLEEAYGLFKVMRNRGCLPNTVAYSALLDGVCKFGSVERALELLGEMEKEGGDCRPNVVTYTSLIQSFCDKGRAIEALGVLEQMEACGCAPNRVTISILVQGLCNDGCVEEAYKLIDRVVAGGSVSNAECYSSLVLSLLKMERVQEAEKLFRTMLAGQVKPDSVASSNMIRRLCLDGRMLDGFSLLADAEELQCLSSIDSDIYSILLLGLCEQNCLVEAEKVARTMVRRGVKLKDTYMDKVVEHLKNSGQEELISRIITNLNC